MGRWSWILAVGCAFGIGIAITSSRSAYAASQATDPRMVGRWKGDATIFVSWTAAKSLTVQVVIAPNDSVTGTIGDARLVDGYFERNRGWLGRTLNIKTDYIITGKLDGPIIAAENIRRDRVMLPLNWKNNRFEGGVATSGTKMGGAKSMVLSAGRLVLERAPEIIICNGAPSSCGGKSP
jgi:hypothetical protein